MGVDVTECATKPVLAAMRLHRPPTIFSAVADDSVKFVGARSVVNMEEPWWQFGLQCARDLFWHGG